MIKLVTLILLTSSLAHSESPNHYDTGSQQGINSTFKIKLTKLLSDYQLAVITLRNTCTLSQTYECTRLPSYDGSFFPTRSNLPYRVYMTSELSTIQISDFFEPGPISLDVEYLTPGSVLEESYSNINYSGTPLATRLNDLNALMNPGAGSYIFYGYLTSPIAKQIKFRIEYDDDALFYIDDVLYFQGNGYSIKYGNGFEISNEQPYSVYIKCSNTYGGQAGIVLYWNINDIDELIPNTNLYAPTRPNNSPVLLETVESYYVCDDVEGFRCRECEGLCFSCEAVTSELFCETCKDNSHLNDRKCYCNNGYYLPSYNQNECFKCLDINCKTCPEAVCSECNPPWRLDENKLCVCSEEDYYIENTICVPIPFLLNIFSSLNSLNLRFSKPLSQPLSMSDLSITILDPALNTLLTPQLQLIHTTIEYNILFNCDIKLKSPLNIKLLFKSPPKDLQAIELFPMAYNSQTFLEFDNPCVENYRIVSCDICKEMGYEDIGCAVCDHVCRCITPSYTLCSTIYPYVKSSVWDDDMLSFSIYFNIQVGKHANHSKECDIYFSESTVRQLGDNSICKLNSDQKSLEVEIGFNSTIISGPYEFKENVIKSEYNSDLQIEVSMVHYITVPSSYPDPEVRMNAPIKITYCSNLVIDGSLSFGNRREFNTEWSVSAEKSDRKLKRFNDILAKLDKQLVIEINSDVIENLTEIEIHLKVTNVFGISSVAAIQVEISQQAVPEVKFLGGPIIEIPSTVEYSPHIDINWPNCSEPPTKYEYQWTIQALQTTNRKIETFTGSQFITIPKGYLNPLSTYSLRAKVIPYSYNSGINESELIIRVIESPIIVLIKGGNRTANNKQDIILDGSSSYDPDNPSLPLQYLWGCYIQNSSTKQELSLNTLSQLIIPASSLFPNRYYIFQLTVSNSLKSSQSTVYLHTTPYPLPIIYLFSQLPILNPSHSNIIQSHIPLSDLQSIELKWYISGGPYHLSSSDDSRSISILPHTLMSGLTYSFSLEYTYQNMKGFSSMEIYVNSPPLHGSVEVIPGEGKGLDNFRFIISGWEDLEDNYPLQYEIYKENKSGAVRLSSMYYGNTFSSILASGDKSRDYVNSYVVKVYDSIGAYNQAYCTATIYALRYQTALTNSQNILQQLKASTESIENVRSIPFILIEIADTVLYSNQDDRLDIDKEISIVQDSLYILAYYCDQMLIGNTEAVNVISALERITSRPEAVNESSRNEALKYLNEAIEHTEGDYDSSTLYQAVYLIEHLHSANQMDTTIQIDDENQAVLRYYEVLNKLGLSVLRNHLLDQDPVIINSDIFEILYQRVSPEGLTNTFRAGDGSVIYPDNITRVLNYNTIENRDSLDVSFIYTKHKPYSEDNKTYDQHEYSLKNVAMMHVNITRTGYENEYGIVILETPVNIELSNLEDPITIYLTAEYLNITDTYPNCTYLNELTYTWDTSGCLLESILPHNSTIICRCDHMSYYSASDLKRDLIDAKDPNQASELRPDTISSSNLKNSYGIIITLTLTFIIHALLSYKFYKIDNLDLKRTPQVLPEIVPENTIELPEEDLSNTQIENSSPTVTLQDINLELPDSSIPKEFENINLHSEDHPRRVQVLHKTRRFLIKVQEIQDKPKGFIELYVMSNEILELKYVIDYSLSKLVRVSLLFYSIYANVFILGFFYNMSSDESIEDQFLQVQEAMSFDVQDVILFIYTKAIVMIPLKLLRLMLKTNPASSKRSVKNTIGVVMIAVGYLGSVLGIVLLGLNFEVISI